MIFASPGDVVTCENGHPICDVALEIKSGDLVRLSAFADWRDQEPKTASPIEPRCKCGKLWIRIGVLGPVGIHVGDEWRASA